MITRLPVIDDPGDKRTGTAITAAWWTQVQDMIDARWTYKSFPTTQSGVVNNLDIGEADLIAFQNSAPLTVTGFLSPSNPTKLGKPLFVLATGGAPVYFPHFDSRSTGPNRVYNYITSGPTPLFHGAAIFVWNGVAWCLTMHEQGTPIDIPYSAGNYVGSAGIWTVEAADVIDHSYIVRGRTAQLMFSANQTSLPGDGSNVLFVRGWPFDFTLSSGYTAGISSVASAVGFGPILAQALSGAGLGVQLVRTDFAAYPASVNNANFYFQLIARLQ